MSCFHHGFKSELSRRDASRAMGLDSMFFQSTVSTYKEKTGRQLNRSHHPVRGGRNETSKGIDPMAASMFKPGRLQFGNESLAQDQRLLWRRGSFLNRDAVEGIATSFNVVFDLQTNGDVL
jgi:hypothetical protein